MIHMRQHVYKCLATHDSLSMGTMNEVSMCKTFLVRGTMEDNLFGKIDSVICKDFVTYGEIKFKLGVSLNLLIGPNGTGKSTIVSAIVLGLGGDPKLLNRSNLISEYIKSGKKTAFLCISLYGKENKLTSFCREIHDTNESQFQINNEKVSEKKFLAVVASYNVQIGNLCQFLPQDRVQDFAKMNAQEILVKTISSVCDQQLIDKFEELKSLRKKQLDGQNTSKLSSDTCKQLKARYENLKLAVNQYNEREEYTNKINVYIAKRIWLEINEDKAKVSETAKSLDAAAELYELNKKQYNGLIKAQQNIIRLSEKLKNETKAKTQMIVEARNEKLRKDDDISELKAAIQEEKRELERSEREICQTNEELFGETKMLETLMGDINQQTGSLKDKKKMKMQHDRNLCDLVEKININIQKRTDINNKLDDCYLPEVNMLRNKIVRLENIQETKMQLLNTKNPNLYKAVRWLQENRNLFAEKIFYPMILELNIPDSGNAKYFENTVKIRDLLAFTCESTDDMSILIDELCVKQQLGINVIHSPPSDRCAYKPNTPIETLHPFGFTAYMVDLVEGPPPILNKLCSLYNIQNIPIGTESITNNNTVIPKHIRQYFKGAKRYTLTTSRYRSEVILTEVCIQGKQLLSTTDRTELSTLKTRLNDIMKKTDALKNERTKIEATINNIEYQRKKEIEAKRAIELNLLHLNQVIKHFEIQQKRVNDLKNKISSISLNHQNQKFEENAQRNIRKIFNIELEKIKILTTLQKLLAEKNVASTKEYIYRNENLSQTNNIKEMKEELDKSKRQCDVTFNALEVIKRRYKQKVCEVKELCNNTTPKDPNFPYANDFKELVNINLEQVKELLQDHQARLDCMDNISRDTIVEFKKLGDEINKLEDEIKGDKNQENKLDNEIRIKYSIWMPKISDLIDTISKQFSHFMASINCVGDVVLQKQDEFNFDSYGITIMVQFRKDAPLQILDKHVQSGGERSMAIAIYTLSLQHITHVPFRCVDEINQGMDPKNEKSLIQMLFQETTKAGSSQYLFVTPKLQSNLKYNEHVSVSVVYNGLFLKNNGFVR